MQEIDASIIIKQLKTFQYFVYAASKDLDISKIISEVKVKMKNVKDISLENQSLSIGFVKC